MIIRFALLLYLFEQFKLCLMNSFALNSQFCIFFCLQYFIFTSELCIPTSDDIASQIIMAISLLKEIGDFGGKISQFELIMFSDYYKSLNLDKVQISFVDTNLYTKYALKLGYSKGADWLTNNIAAVFVDFNVRSRILNKIIEFID